jgi:uncharacterized protein YktA (UPF0223 family)
MTKLVFLLEERSAKEVLLVLLPQIVPVEKVTFQCLSHEGKSDLQRSIPIKIRAWNEPDVHFVILHDQDSADCVTLKKELYSLAKNDNHPDTLIRIVCSELESWFLGDLSAVEKAFAVDLSKKRNKTIYQNPDAIANAKDELKRLVPAYQQIAGSQSISKYMSIDKNKSKSFQVFVSGIKALCGKVSEGTL